jgi:hypothetical protein
LETFIPAFQLQQRFQRAEHAIDGSYGAEELDGHRSAAGFGKADAGL